MEKLIEIQHSPEIPNIAKTFPALTVLRSACRMGAVVVLSAIILCRILLVRILVRDYVPRVIELGHRWAKSISRALGLRFQVTGQLPPPGVLIVSNHRSYSDIWVISSQVPCTYMAKAEVASWPLIGRGARMGDVVWVKREDRTSRHAALQTLKAVLQRGRRVVVFAEGTTFQGPGIRGMRPRCFDLAASAGIPVVPIALEYQSPQDAWVGDDTFVRHFLDRFRFRRVKVSVAFGPTFNSTSGEDLRCKTEDWIRSNLRMPY